MSRTAPSARSPGALAHLQTGTSPLRHVTGSLQHVNDPHEVPTPQEPVYVQLVGCGAPGLAQLVD